LEIVQGVRRCYNSLAEHNIGQNHNKDKDFLAENHKDFDKRQNEDFDIADTLLVYMEIDIFDILEKYYLAQSQFCRINILLLCCRQIKALR
jgi:hypothetical protein